MLAACAHVAPQVVTVVAVEESALPEFPNVFGDRPMIPTADQVSRLTPAQEQEFLAYFNAPENQAVKPYQRVSRYLFENTLSLQYEETTYTAAETLNFNKGNCMSLAILTTALVRLAGVDIDYQLVDSAPVFGLTGNVVSKQIHVTSLVFQRKDIDPTNITFQYPERVVIDYFVGKRGRFIGNLSADAFTAMYYLNIAGEAIETADYAKAYWYTLEAFKHNRSDAAVWNTMAVVYRRAGQLATAEQIYLHAIEHAEDKLTLLKNYRVLLTSQNRTAEASRLEQRIDNMDDPSPFHWYALARESYVLKDYSAALRYFDKALVIAPYLHEAYLGKAQSYYQLGRQVDARVAMELAISNVDRKSTRSLYEAKLMALSGN